MTKNWKLLGMIQMIETTRGLRKSDDALCKYVGDYITKIKVRPNVEIIEQINSIYHEWTHFLFIILKEYIKEGKLIPSNRAEEKICKEIASKAERIIKRYFEINDRNKNNQ